LRDVVGDMRAGSEKIRKDDNFFCPLLGTAGKAFGNAGLSQFEESHFDLRNSHILRGVNGGAHGLAECAYFVVGGLTAAAVRDDQEMAV